MDHPAASSCSRYIPPFACAVWSRDIRILRNSATDFKYRFDLFTRSIRAGWGVCVGGGGFSTRADMARRIYREQIHAKAEFLTSKFGPPYLRASPFYCDLARFGRPGAAILYYVRIKGAISLPRLPGNRKLAAKNAELSAHCAEYRHRCPRWRQMRLLFRPNAAITTITISYFATTSFRDLSIF